MSDLLGRTALINEALANLLVVGAGQTADSEDVTKVNGKIDGLLAELSARDIVSVSDDEDIQPEYFSALAELLANECAPSFGQPKNPVIKDAAEERLRIMTRSGPVRTLKTESTLRAGSIRTQGRSTWPR